MRHNTDWPRRRSWGVGAAVLVGLIQTLGTRAAAGDQAGALDASGYLLLLAGPAALLFRRRLPVPVLAVCLAATVGYAALDYPGGPTFIAAVVAIFAAVGAGQRRATWVLAGLAYAGYVATTRSLGHALAVAAWLLVVLALAEAHRVRSAHFAEVSRFRAEQARARAEQERRQASEERLRIARELHDVLGHHLSLIRVQAGVGLHLMDAHPEQARAALTTIKSASDEALAEVRSVLGILRLEQDGAPRTPAPGLDRVPDLAAEAGFEVRTELSGEPRPLPAAVDRAAYRIVQEALTNVRRHAGPGATATVAIGYGDRELVLQVDDDGVGVPADSNGGDGSGASSDGGASGSGFRGAMVGAFGGGSGNGYGGASAALDNASSSDGASGNGFGEETGGSGIAGMRERAAALGGSLTAGARPEGGFRVRVSLPLPPVPAAAQPAPS